MEKLFKMAALKIFMAFVFFSLLAFPPIVGAQEEVDPSVCKDLSGMSLERKNEVVKYNLRQDTGAATILDSLRRSQPVQVTEADISSWVNNDLFDPDGSLRQIKDFMIEEQTVFGSVGVSDLTLPTLIEMKQNLDAGYPYPLGWYSPTLQSSHDLILLGATIAGERVVLEVIDPNVARGGEPSKLVCRKKLSSEELVCRDGSLTDLEPFIAQSDVTLVKNLITARLLYCRDGDPAGGDLCRRNPLGWLRSSAPLLPNNFNGPTRAGAGGVCAGWISTLLRLAYLADFVGERSASPVLGCASQVLGEKDTFVCKDNKSACVVDVEWSVAGVYTAKLAPGIAQCAWQTRSTPVADPAVSRLYGIDSVTCNGRGVKKSVTSSKTASQGLTATYTAKPWTGGEDFKTLGSQFNLAVGAFKQFALSFQSSYDRLLALVPKVIKPTSCAFTSGELRFVYRKGYLFSSPKKYATEADIASLNASSLAPSLKQISILALSDTVIDPRNNVVWFWLPGAAEPSRVAVDNYVSGYIGQLRALQERKGVDNHCSIDKTELPPRFVQFLQARGSL